MTGTDSEASPLTLRLFGPIEARVGGEPLPRLRSRKGQWLLALLVLRSGAEVERAWLAGTLWPDSPEPQALGNLRTTLADLRQALGPQAACLRSPTPHSLALDLSGVRADVIAFDAAIAQSDAPGLERAVALYRGPLLEGCPEAWICPERETRQQAYLIARETLAARALASGAPEVAERHLRLAVAVDPLREIAQRNLMQVLAAGGNYAAALLVYRELRLLLHRELNAEPDAETQALFQRLRTAARENAARANGANARLASTNELPDGLNAAADFLPRHRPATQRHNLPVQPTPLIGRESEVAEALALARRDDVWLLTFTGAGGTGKTRLALEVAGDLLDAFPDGGFFVSLAPIRDPLLVASTIAQALGFQETEGRPLLESLRGYLQERELLLLLDNFEHVVEAAPMVAELWASCPRLKVLVTSRAPLHLRGEHEFSVPPLPVPDLRRLPRAEELSRNPSVALFLQRAAAVKRDFAITSENAAAVAEICCRLDGLPLAIELAATRVRMFPPEALLACLDRRLELLTGGARDLPVRQQTLRGTIAWSYELLESSEQQLFRRLSVFVGGFALEEAEALRGEVASDGRQTVGGLSVLEAIGSLLDKNLLRQEGDTGKEPRFGMLETIREYAEERLEESGEADALRARHLQVFLALAEQADARLQGPEESDWLDRLEAEHENLRAALSWTLEREDAGHALRLTAAMGWFWRVRGYYREGLEWLQRALALPGASERTAARAKALHRAGIIAYLLGDEVARALLEESLAIGQDLGEKPTQAWTLIVLGIVARYWDGDREAAGARLEQGLAMARDACEPGLIAHALDQLGGLAFDQGNDEAARILLEESLQGFQELGWKLGSTWPLSHLTEIAFRQGDYTSARSFTEQSLALRREIGERWGIPLMYLRLADLARLRRDDSSAQRLYRESLVMLWELRFQGPIVRCLNGLAELAGAQGQPARAARLLGTAEALHEAIRARRPCDVYHLTGDDRLVATLRAAMGEETFAAAWAAGREMPLEQVIAEALAGTTDAPSPSPPASATLP